MKFVLDTHCHTIVSGHAYSTLTEMVEGAKQNGMELIAITEHGPALPSAPHYYYFGNLKVVPPEIQGVKILKGVEANIIDYDGNIDMPETYLKRLDIILASLHDICIEPGTVQENTSAIVGAMNNPDVDIIAHSGNPLFPVDYDKILETAKKTNTLLEINNSSFVATRKGSYKNCYYIAQKCKEMEIPIVIGSDAHYALDAGEFTKARRLLEEVDFPEELIMNTHVEKLIKYLKDKGRTPFHDIRIHDHMNM